MHMYSIYDYHWPPFNILFFCMFSAVPIGAGYVVQYMWRGWVRIVSEWLAARSVLRRTRGLFWKGILLGLRPQHQILDERTLAESHLFTCCQYKMYTAYMYEILSELPHGNRHAVPHRQYVWMKTNETYASLSMLPVCSQANVLQRAWDNAQAEGVAGRWLGCLRCMYVLHMYCMHVG